jgi:RecA DNA recombination protein
MKRFKAMKFGFKSFELHFGAESSRIYQGEPMANLSWTVPSDPRWKRAVDISQTAAEKNSNSLQIPALNHLLLNGLDRGILVEATGTRSSGKTSICVHILAQATKGGEVCAIVDLHNTFHPDSAAANGVQLDRVVWVRCKCNPEYTMRATDLLLHAGGFGVVLLDLSEAQGRVLNRIPPSYWYRFQRAIQNTPTILLICANTPQAKAASRYSLECQARSFSWLAQRHFTRLRGITTIVRQRKLAAIRPERPLQITVA